MASDGDFRSPSAFRRLLGRISTYAAMLYRLDWLAMFVFARFEIVQKFAGREGKLGPPPRQVTVSEPSIMLTQLTPEEIVRRVSLHGIAEGLRLGKETVADLISFAACALCYGNAERHRPLDRDQCKRLITAGAVIGDYLDGIAGCNPLADVRSVCRTRASGTFETGRP
jgi:hypothetical protein